MSAITITRHGITRRMALHGARIVVTRPGERLIVGAPPRAHELERLCAHMGLPLRDLEAMVEVLMQDEGEGQGPRPAA